MAAESTDLEYCLHIIKTVSTKVMRSDLYSNTRVVDVFLEMTSFLNDSASDAQRKWHFKNNIFEVPKCQSCGNPTKWVNSRKYYAILCSDECKHSETKAGRLAKAKASNVTHYLPDDASDAQRLWHIDNRTHEVPNCKTCGNPTRWASSKNRYAFHCSDSCRWHDPSVNQKRENTCVERYGHDKLLSDKKHELITRQTCFENHGVTHPLKKREIWEATDDSLYDNLGPKAREILRARALKTMQNKYAGGEDISFGKIFAAPEFVEARLKTRFENWLPLKKEWLVENDVKLLDSYTINDNRFTTKQFLCLSCDNPFDDNLRDGLVPRCPICNPLNSVNWEQQTLFDYIATLTDEELVLGSRTIVGPQELDLYAPSSAIAIEYNGLYWHSEMRDRRGSDYHIGKTNKCNELGIRLIHIFADEWQHKQDICKAVLRRAFNVRSPRTLYARKCKVVKLSAPDARKFLELSHLQGSCKSWIRYGLTYDDELVAVMTFSKPRFDKQFEYEIVRLAYNPEVSIVGGTNKMFKQFIKDYSPNSIVSYSNSRWFDGKVYANLGFEFVENTKPSYYYVDTKNHCIERLSRFKFQKHKMKSFLPIFDEAMTEAENAMNNGFYRIWDVGHRKWSWKISQHDV